MSYTFLCLLILICRPRRDGRLSRPWCEVAPAEIRTCNLSSANLALYHTATSAHVAVCPFVKTQIRHWTDELISYNNIALCIHSMLRRDKTESNHELNSDDAADTRNKGHL